MSYYMGDYYRGDPGLFGSIGKFIGGALGTVGKVASILPVPGAGILGGIAGAAAGLLQKSGQQAGVSGILKTAAIPFNPSLALIPSTMGGGNPILQRAAIPNYVSPLQGAGAGQALVPAGGAGCSVKGYHLNKSTYYSARAGGLVPKGTACVKNRRMNPFNPRALRRAARRAHSFLKMSRRLVAYYQPHAKKGKAYIKARKRSR